MAPADERDARSDSRSLDYKSAFYGACALVAVFAGLSWRLFSTDLADADKARAVTDQDQWVAIRAIERQLDGTKRDVADCDEHNTKIEARVRDLEHSKDRR